MHHVARWLLNGLTVLSLLLFVATSMLWVRSYSRADALTYVGASRWRAVSARGGLYAERVKVRRRYGEAKSRIPLSGSVVNYTEMRLDYREWLRAALSGRDAQVHTWTWKVSDGTNSRQAGWLIHNSMFALPRWSWPAWPTVERVDYCTAISSSTSTPGYATEYWLAGHEIWMPCWVVAVASGLLPLIQLRRLVSGWRRRRRPVGSCPVCGYDLRASPDRCPECGKATIAPEVVPAVSSSE